MNANTVCDAIDSTLTLIIYETTTWQIFNIYTLLNYILVWDIVDVFLDISYSMRLRMTCWMFTPT